MFPHKDSSESFLGVLFVGQSRRAKMLRSVDTMGVRTQIICDHGTIHVLYFHHLLELTRLNFSIRRNWFHSHDTFVIKYELVRFNLIAIVL